MIESKIVDRAAKAMGERLTIMRDNAPSGLRDAAEAIADAGLLVHEDDDLARRALAAAERFDEHYQERLALRIAAGDAVRTIGRESLARKAARKPKAQWEATRCTGCGPTAVNGWIVVGDGNVRAHFTEPQARAVAAALNGVEP
jgi:hypothetical protein